ncbi:MAG: SDR family NAD(P)-dependent oxidoreductase [Paludibacteraceae bacterium]|nr:SDR family NAD(P)-dependent oxidoreductase [Paludibacteraceae bacterium]MBQ8939852.1 SDR family NAD(P)-dependent oxidoreductase [Paludibacteraceae bacterium]
MRILIIGASSGIGRELAIQYATKGNKVIAVARRKPLLCELFQYSSNIQIAQCDISNIEETKTLLSMIFKETIHLAIICSGIGDFNSELDFAIEKQIIDINILGWTFCVDTIYKNLEEQSSGHLVILSSCGGLRGEPLSPSYSASKAYQINYIEALCKKAYKSKLPIHITDIRPGLVNTRMAKGSGLFWVMPTEKAAKQIINAIAQKKNVAIVTKRWGIIHWIMRHLPRSFYIRI